MPVRYNYAAAQYEARCVACDRSIALPEGMSDWNQAPDEAVELLFRFHSGNGRYLNRCRECERAHVRAWRQNRRVPAAVVAGVSLGIDRKFGVELELTFPATMLHTTIQSRLQDAGLRSWRVKSDGSLSGGPGRTGWEIVSPPMRGQDGIDQVRTACRVLKTQCDAKPNRTCGLHVHHEVADYTIDDFKRLVRGWTNSQDAIDLLVSPSRRGRGASQYCQRLSSGEVSSIMSAGTVRDLTYLRRVSRYRTLNLLSYARYGTVEIRQHQGTVEAEKVVNWILFGQSVIEHARQDTLPRTTTVSDLFTRIGERLADEAQAFLTRRSESFAGAVA